MRRDSETKQPAARALALKMQAEGEKPAAIVAALAGKASRAAVYRWLKPALAVAGGDVQPGFLAAWDALPRRTGNNPRDRAARAYRARLADGCTPDELLLGAYRYARYCAATGKTGSEFVMQGATFFGPEKPFQQPWAIEERWDTNDDTIMAEAGRLGVETLGKSRDSLKASIRAKHAQAATLTVSGGEGVGEDPEDAAQPQLDLTRH